MKTFGYLIILVAICLTVFWCLNDNLYKEWAFALCLVVIFVGIVTIMYDKLKEISIKGVGNISTVVDKATEDGQTITEIMARVEAQSATIDLVATSAQDAKALVTELENKNTIVEEKLEILDDSIDEAKSALTELETSKEFIMVVLAAQNDDRKAFDTLDAWARDETNPFHQKASLAWYAVVDKHNPIIPKINFTIHWNEGEDPRTISVSALGAKFGGSNRWEKVALLDFICKLKEADVTKLERLDFLMRVMQEDESLYVVEYASRHFISETKYKLKPLAINHLSEWWKEHRIDYIEK